MLLIGPSPCWCPIIVGSSYEQKEEKKDGKEGRGQGSKDKRNEGKRGKRQGGTGFGLQADVGVGARFINLGLPAVVQAGPPIN